MIIHKFINLLASSFLTLLTAIPRPPGAHECHTFPKLQLIIIIEAILKHFDNTFHRLIKLWIYATEDKHEEVDFFKVF